jgi:molybdate transport system substrate-binding protein
MTRLSLLAFALLALYAAAAPAAPEGASGSEPLTSTTPRLSILAAASLTEVFKRIDGRHAYSFGGSNQLAFQIRQGAPADVFASASPIYTRALFREGLVERPRFLVSSSLVLAVPRSNPAGLRTVFDLERRDVKLVVAAPQVPVGAYTREVLARLGLTSVLDKVVSQEPDVKGVVGKIALGQADAGFVYRTDVTPVASRVRAIAIPARAQPTVRYEIAVVKASRRKAAARAWVKKIRTGARSRTLLKQAGFGLR